MVVVVMNLVQILCTVVVGNRGPEVFSSSALFVGLQVRDVCDYNTDEVYLWSPFPLKPFSLEAGPSIFGALFP